MLKFMPKEPVELAPPQDAVFSTEELARCDGVQLDRIYVAIKGVVYDVSRNAKAYGPGAGYSKLAGKDASRALGKTLLDPADVDTAVSWDYSSLTEKQMATLDNWDTFFRNRYNVMGTVLRPPAAPAGYLQLVRRWAGW